MRRLGVATMVAMLGLAVGCSEQGNPFPYVPNLPDDYNLTTQYNLREGETEELLGDVAMFTHEVFEEYFEGLVSEHASCFDSAGHCLELLYRDRETNQRYTFAYDSLGRRIEELCYLDSAGTPYDSLETIYTRTTYSYSRNGRTCRAASPTPTAKDIPSACDTTGRAGCTVSSTPTGRVSPTTTTRREEWCAQPSPMHRHKLLNMTTAMACTSGMRPTVQKCIMTRWDAPWRRCVTSTAAHQ